MFIIGIEIYPLRPEVWHFYQCRWFDDYRKLHSEL